MAITINGSGTITGISAGGLPDGSVTSDDIAAAAVTDAKIASGVSASKLTGTLPALDGSALTNLPGGGKVLQVVEGSSTTDTTITSTSYTDTGLSATITPSSTSSKILVIVTQRLNTKRPDPFVSGAAQLVRGSTSLAVRSLGYTTDHGTYGNDFNQQYSQSYLDSPSTTSATTYKTQAKISSGFTSNSVRTGGDRSSIILMEIAG
jgi:hypothetical protein